MHNGYLEVFQTKNVFMDDYVTYLACYKVAGTCFVGG